MSLVKTHGSLNEIFALDATPAAWRVGRRAARVRPASLRPGRVDRRQRRDLPLRRQRAGHAGVVLQPRRLLGRVLRERDARPGQADPGPARHRHRGRASGGRDYTVRRAPSTPEGVRQVLLELPAVRFAAPPPAPFGGFTAVAVPNPHVVAVVAEYSEPDLIEAGQARGRGVPRRRERLVPARRSRRTQPPPPPPRRSPQRPEVFVRTFERGAGLTPSCGSGVVASRAAYSRVTGLDPGQRLVVRNAGGVAAASIRVRDGAWLPVLEGNATIVYEAEAGLDGRQAGPVEYAAAERTPPTPPSTPRTRPTSSPPASPPPTRNPRRAPSPVLTCRLRHRRLERAAFGRPQRRAART